MFDICAALHWHVVSKTIDNERKLQFEKSRVGETEKDGKGKNKRVKPELILEAYCLISKQAWELHSGVNITL